MSQQKAKNGYILLLSILVIGTVSTAVVTSLLLLGTDAQRTARAVELSSKAIALSQGCAEYALEMLRNNPAYSGDEIISDFMSGGTCEILTIIGAGNNDRIICAVSTVDDVSRRIEIIVQELFPNTNIYSWQEVPIFSLCD